MTNEAYLEKVHKDILDVMIEVKRICEENNIRYYMIGGTLLGAVRHKGFIPWDDDLDIVMPREDFNRFISLPEELFRPPYRLVWTSNQKKYWNAFAKVENSNTLFLESSHENASLRYGIYVDIFPIDEVNGFSKKIEIKKRRVLFIRGIQTLKSGAVTPKGIKKRIQSIIGSFHTMSGWAKEQERIMTHYNGKGYSYYANYGSFYSIKKQTMPKDFYGEGVDLPFESLMLKAPTQYTKVLTSIFGPNYMELPPNEKRMVHYPTMVRFSDGKIMEFDKNLYAYVNTKE